MSQILFGIREDFEKSKLELSRFYCINNYFADGAVYLSRDVSIVDEDYASYSIGICIEDTSHPLQGQVCGQLDVTFNSKCFAFYKLFVFLSLII